ncbi:MAG TPA: class I adenylate-forming enzyme family protein, partial [Candidatus Methylomirabilis sp.]|nr:class I adenylate-forming enzyme family protein [Candidatus Methylomirabilis sp.]
MSASLLLSQVLDDVWRRHGHRIAVREGESEVRFGELLGRSVGVTAALEPYVAQPGTRVAVVMPNSAAFVAAFAAVARLGGVVAPLNPLYRQQELRHYLVDLQAGAVVVQTQLVPIVSAVVSTLESAPAVLAVGSDGGVSLARAGTAEATPIPAAGSPPLLQQYTSGSTGIPKRVVRTHANLLAELEALRATFHIDERDRFIGVAPFSHVNGLVRTMMSSMYVGACLYPLPEFHRRKILELITRERITFFGGVPSMFSLLGGTPPRGTVDLSSLRVVFSSSAPLS